MNNFKIRALNAMDICNEFISEAKGKDIYIDHYKTKCGSLCLVYFNDDTMNRLYLEHVYRNGGEDRNDDYLEVSTSKVSYNERYEEHGKMDDNSAFTKIKPIIKLVNNENSSNIIVYNNFENEQGFIYEATLNPLVWGHYEDTFSLRNKYIKDKYAKFKPECEKMTLFQKIIILLILCGVIAVLLAGILT